MEPGWLHLADSNISQILLSANCKSNFLLPAPSNLTINTASDTITPITPAQMTIVFLSFSQFNNLQIVTPSDGGTHACNQLTHKKKQK